MWFKTVESRLRQRLRVGGVDLVFAWWRPVKVGLPLLECLESDTSSLPNHLWTFGSQSRELLYCSAQNYRVREKNKWERKWAGQSARDWDPVDDWHSTESALRAWRSPISFSIQFIDGLQEGEIRTHCSWAEDNKDLGSGDNLFFMPLIMRDSPLRSQTQRPFRHASPWGLWLWDGSCLSFLAFYSHV